jgi:hypothetical protein
MRVVDDDRLAGGERLVDEAPLPRVTAARVRPEILADVRVRRGEMAPVEARLTGARQSNQDDAFEHARCRSAKERVKKSRTTQKPLNPQRNMLEVFLRVLRVLRSTSVFLHNL